MIQDKVGDSNEDMKIHLPFFPRYIDADSIKGRFHIGLYYRSEITKNKFQRWTCYRYVPETNPAKFGEDKW